MRRWLSLLLLCLALIVGDKTAPEIRDKIEPCPANAVCAIFLLGACSIDGAWPEQRSNRGYFWDTFTHCRDDDSIDLFSAGLQIQTLTLRKWKVTMTTFLFDTNPKGYLRIDFADAKIEIVDDTRMALSWNNGKRASTHLMTTETFTTSKQVDYVRYSAEIEADGEVVHCSDPKLINLIHGREITATLGPYDIGVSFTMKDRRFEERLDELSICDFSEIQQVCYGACHQLARANATVVCPSKIWYNYDDESNRRWKTVDRIECRRGSWVAEWSGGTLKADATLEFQCAAGEPVQPTTTTIAPPSPSTSIPPSSPAPTSALGFSARSYLIIGCSVGGAVLLLVGIAFTLFFLVRACKRRRTGKGMEKGTGKGAASGKKASDATRPTKPVESVQKPVGVRTHADAGHEMK